MAMHLRFWGTRGSVPGSLTTEALRAKLKAVVAASAGRSYETEADLDHFLDALPFAQTSAYGTNTPCVQICSDELHEEYIICDGGTGIREFGACFMAEASGKAATFHIILSHLHWDHIQGLPFFEPAYHPWHRIVIHTCHPETRKALRDQMAPPFFPVSFDQFRAQFDWVYHKPDQPFEVAGFEVTACVQHHPGISYGYRFRGYGKTIVYSTDAEHRAGQHDLETDYIAFISNADALIFDGMYSLSDARAQLEWGHSSPLVGVDLSRQGQVPHLIVMHHDPAHDDATLDQLARHTRNYAQTSADVSTAYPRRITFASDGLQLEV